MDGDGSFVPGSMPAFDRASRGGRFDGEGEEEDDDDVGKGYFSKRVCACLCVCVCVLAAWCVCELKWDGIGCGGPSGWRQGLPSHVMRHAWLYIPPLLDFFPFQHDNRSTPPALHSQAVPAGLEMEIALMREERERDQRLKEE